MTSAVHLGARNSRGGGGGELRTRKSFDGGFETQFGFDATSRELGLHTAQLKFRRRLSRVAFRSSHDALIHAAILASDSVEPEQFRLPAGARKLPAVLVPRDKMRSSLRMRANLAPELGVASQMHAEQGRCHLHVEGRRDDQPEIIDSKRTEWHEHASFFYTRESRVPIRS